jgi:alcohol dehydrogenase class IV
MLAHTFAYNLPACPEAGAAAQQILGENPAGRIFDLVAGLGLPTRLADLGLPEEGIEVVARLACANPYKNPRPFDERAIVGLLQRAWGGSRPTADVPHA